jgi:tetratricopeptide (TPR) repeat protein
MEKERAAVQLFDDLLQHAANRDTQLIAQRLQGEQLRELSARLDSTLAGRDKGELWVRLLRLALIGDDFRSGKELLVEIPGDTAQRNQAFAELEHWITRQAQPTPWMLITLSEARRDSSNDPLAGFDVATQAALLAPNDHNVQAAYTSWLERVPSQVLHERKLTQAMYLVSREERHELLPTVFSELDLARAAGLNTRNWMEQLVGVVLLLRGEHRTKARLELLRQFTVDNVSDLPEVLPKLAGDLDTTEQLELLHRLAEAAPAQAEQLESLAAELTMQIGAKDRERVTAELEAARKNERPVRYSAGELKPGEPGTEVVSGTKPWRRALAIARRKRVAGDTDGAIRDLQAALELDPQEPELSLELAESFGDKGQYELARRIYGETQSLLGDHGNTELRLRTLYGLATVIEHLERPAEAVHCLEELLVIRHDYRDSRERLDQLKVKLGAVQPDPPPSNIAANVILDEILELLSARTKDRAEVSE